MKLKLDSAKLKEFSIQHLEKIALGIFGLVFVWMCYSALQTKRYDKTPKQLHDSTVDIRNRVTGQAWKPEDHGIQLPNPPYAKKVEDLAANDIKPLAMSIWDPPISENKVRRDEPKYFAAEELRATYGFGAVSLAKEGMTGKQWVVVTALIPLGKETAEYKRLFANATFTDLKKDAPHYSDFEIQRAEVTSADPKAALEWTPLNLDEAADELNKFHKDKLEVVDKKLIESYLCDPLPPLVGKQYDATVAHDPQIPFAPQKPEAVNAAKPVEVTPPGGGRKRPRRDEGPAVNAPPPAAGATAKAEEVVPYRLFRFFDFSVENNKTYRYRIKLLLENPNLGIVKRYLKSPALAEGDIRTTDWSDATAALTIPRDFRLLAGDVIPARGLNEQKAKVLIVKWEPPAGTEVSQEFLKLRGQMLNFADEPSLVPIPGKPPETKPENVTYTTDSLLVAFAGGDSLTAPTNNRPFKSPAEVLLMGPDGQLTLRSQIADASTYKAEFRKMPDSRKKPEEGDDAAGVPGDAGEKQPGGLDSILNLPNKK
jgi:hypothetical protein